MASRVRLLLSYLGYRMMLVFLLAGCTGDQARYTGRVASIQGDQLCLGPNTSGPQGTCGRIPAGVATLPAIGDCVSLTATYSEGGKKVTWRKSALLHGASKACR
jgi:hypothetical protein